MRHFSNTAVVRSTVGHSPAVYGREAAPVTPSEIEQIWHCRRSRNSYFPEGLFADPAWDILLHLYATELFGSRTTISSAAMASNVPETTGHRWLCHLIECGLCARAKDPTDRRRAYVKLTERGRQAMDDYFSGQRDEAGILTPYLGA